jgi:N-acetyl-anhydromuramyl-L-alanine amidase AmpD
MAQAIEQVAISGKNFAVGRNGRKPTNIINHFTFGSMNGAIERFRDPNSGVSAHYGIRNNGQILQFVQDDNTAWANGPIREPNLGAAPWIAGIRSQGINPNNVTLSIEWEGVHRGGSWKKVSYRGVQYDTWKRGLLGQWYIPNEAQIQSGLYLIRKLSEWWGIPISRSTVGRHADLDSVTKSFCPGDGFPLARILGDLGDPYYAKYALSPAPAYSLYRIKGPSTCNEAAWNAFFLRLKSPIATNGHSYGDYFRLFDKAGLNAAFCAAQFYHESQAGTDGVAVETSNWGNLRAKRDGSIGRAVGLRDFGDVGTFRVYGKVDGWWQSALDYRDLLLDAYLEDTIPTAIARYAPRRDKNSPESYARAVLELMAQLAESSAVLREAA